MAFEFWSTISKVKLALCKFIGESGLPALWSALLICIFSSITEYGLIHRKGAVSITPSSDASPDHVLLTMRNFPIDKVKLAYYSKESAQGTGPIAIGDDDKDVKEATSVMNLLIDVMMKSRSPVMEKGNYLTGDLQDNLKDANLGDIALCEFRLRAGLKDKGMYLMAQDFRTPSEGGAYEGVGSPDLIKMKREEGGCGEGFIDLLMYKFIMPKVPLKFGEGFDRTGYLGYDMLQDALYPRFRYRPVLYKASVIYAEAITAAILSLITYLSASRGWFKS